MKVWASSAQAILVDSRVFTSDFAFYDAILLEFDNAERLHHKQTQRRR